MWEEGKVGIWSLFPSCCEAESDPFPRHRESRVSRITEASLPPLLPLEKLEFSC